MSYDRAKQIVSGNVPPWQKLLDSVQMSGAGAFVPSTGEELQDVPRVAGSLASDFTTIPFTDIGPRKFLDVPEPQTDYGENLRTAGNVGAWTYGGMKAVGGISNLIKKAEIGKVSDIQRAFGPWVKGYTKEYGKALRSGIKQVIRGAGQNRGNLIQEVRRAINPLRRSDSYQDLPKRTRDAIEVIYTTGSNLKTREVLNATSRIRKSSSKLDEGGKLARQTTQKLKKIVKSKSSKFSEVDAEYGEFSGTRDVMERFRPDLVGQGPYGTQAGTKILRNIGRSEPGTIKAMERFGQETGINIVGPAKVASAIRGVGKFIGKSLPWAGGGGFGYLVAKKLLGQQGGYQPQNMY